MSEKPFQISIQDSLALKGIALLLLLWHHLFYIQSGLYDDVTIGGYGIIHQTGIIAKVCVAVFVLLSGYGLTIQYQSKPMKFSEFIKRRFLKLFIGFWIIWLLFVPIGFLFYDRTLENVFGDYAIAKLVVQFFGLQNITGFYGINATWWFYTCIILLYFCFPALNALSKRWLIVATMLSFGFMFINIPYVQSIRFYLISFICGMWMARMKLITPPPIVKKINILGYCLNFHSSLALMWTDRKWNICRLDACNSYSDGI